MLDDEKQNRINKKWSRLAKDALKFHAEGLYILHLAFNNLATLLFFHFDYEILKVSRCWNNILNGLIILSLGMMYPAVVLFLFT